MLQMSPDPFRGESGEHRKGLWSFAAQDWSHLDWDGSASVRGFVGYRYGNLAVPMALGGNPVRQNIPNSRVTHEHLQVV